MPTRNRGGNPEKAGIPPRFEKDGYLSETAFRVSGRYPKSPSYAAATRGQTPQNDGEWHLVEKKKKKKEKNKKKKEREVPVPSAQELEERKKVPRRSPAARSGDAIRVSVKDGESYAEILKAVKAKVNPQNSGVEVLSIRRTRKEEILLVLKKGGNVSAFEKALDQVVGQRAEVKSLVSKRSVEVRNLNKQ